MLNFQAALALDKSGLFQIEGPFQMRPRPSGRELASVFAISFVSMIAIAGLVQQQDEWLRLLRGLCTADASGSLSALLHLWIRPSAAHFALLAVGVLACRSLAGPPGSFQARLGAWAADFATLSVAMMLGCVAAQILSAGPEGHAVGMITGMIGSVALRIGSVVPGRRTPRQLGDRP